MMRETKKSLSAYLIFVGVLGVLVGGLTIYRFHLQGVLNPLWLIWVIINLALDAAYIYCGFNLGKLLLRSPGFIIAVLCLGFLQYLSTFVVLFLINQDAENITQLLLGAAILLYLIFNVVRLAKKEKENQQIMEATSEEEESS